VPLPFVATSATSDEQGLRRQAETIYLLPDIPSEEHRQTVKAEIIKAANGWLGRRIDEVFEMADDDLRSKSDCRIDWCDINEIGCQICGCLGDDLDNDLGEWPEEILDAELGCRGSKGFLLAK